MTENVVDREPAGMRTLAGRSIEPLFPGALKVTVTPGAGAGPVSDTPALVLMPPITLGGVNVKCSRTGGMMVSRAFFSSVPVYRAEITAPVDAATALVVIGKTPISAPSVKM